MTIEGRFRRRLGAFLLDAGFTVPGRGVTGIQGPSGAGKTSLLRAVAGIDRVPGARLRVGDIIWQDETVFMPPHRREVGFVFQEASLFSHLDVAGNLYYAARRGGRGDGTGHRDEAVELLDLGPLLKRDTHTLSGGERRRVAIARALAAAPQLLLLDEPLAGLDRARRQALMPYLDALHRDLDIPVMLVSHDPADLDRLADHLLVMEAGRVVASGPVQAVATDLDLPLPATRDAATVIDARVLGHDRAWALTRLGFSGGELVVPDGPVAGDPAPADTAVRVRIAARDVSLTTVEPEKTSILNILPSVIEKIHSDNAGQLLVRLRCGDDAVLARVTAKSADMLGLVPGMNVFMQVKSLALLS